MGVSPDPHGCSRRARSSVRAWAEGPPSIHTGIRHPETADARRLVQQRLLMGVEPQVDDVADAESVDICQLRLGRLAPG